MANTDVTKVSMALNTAKDVTATAATATVANTAEVFDVIPGRDGKFLLIINNVATDQGSVTFSLAAGDMWGAGAALTGTVAQGKSTALQLDSFKFKAGATGKMSLTVTPATGKILKTDHALTIQAIELR